MAEIPVLTPDEFVKQRIATCQEEILASLKKHNCLMDATVTLSRNSIEPTVRIVAVKDEPKAPVGA